MDTSKVSICVLVLLGVLSAHGIRYERSAGDSGASSGAGSSAGSWGAGMSSPWYGPGGGDLQNNIQNHFKSVEAQNKAIQAQIEAQIRAQQQAFGAPGGNGWNSPAHASDGGGAAWGPAHASDGGGAAWGHEHDSDYEVDGGSTGGSGPAWAGSSINVGPGGGQQSGQIGPVSPGIESRFAEDIPSPSGDNVAVFSSSSSSQSVGPDGKVISHKRTSTGVNDNGKVTIRTVHDP